MSVSPADVATVVAACGGRHDIPFPFPPYPVQQDLMHGLYDKMESGTAFCGV
jgi:hypothetical protein